MGPSRTSSVRHHSLDRTIDVLSLYTETPHRTRSINDHPTERCMCEDLGQDASGVAIWFPETGRALFFYMDIDRAGALHQAHCLLRVMEIRMTAREKRQGGSNISGAGLAKAGVSKDISKFTWYERLQSHFIYQRVDLHFNPLFSSHLPLGPHLGFCLFFWVKETFFLSRGLSADATYSTFFVYLLSVHSHRTYSLSPVLTCIISMIVLSSRLHK